MARISLKKLEDVPLETRGYYQMSAETWGLLSNLIMTLGHCPILTKTLVPFANSFIFYPISGNSIDRKMRELVINKVSRYNESHYSITHHTLIALKENVEPKKLLALDAWQNSKIYSDRERIAIEYAERGSGDSNNVSNQLFNQLHKHFTDPEIVELTVLIGHFNLLNRWLNALQVEDEPEFIRIYNDLVPEELKTSISYYRPSKQLSNSDYTLKRPKFVKKKAHVPPVQPNDLQSKQDYATLAVYELARLSWQTGDAPPNLIKTWAQCPEIAQTEVPFVNSFAFNKDSTIPRGLKELAINIVGRINQGYYTISAHEWYAQEFGKISAQKLDDLENWKTSTLLNDTEKLVIEYAINVTTNSNFISEDLFKRIRSKFKENEIVELTFLICHFQHVTRFLNLLQVELEEGRVPD
jgi:alkylhydroperoxidase family enzyme